MFAETCIFTRLNVPQPGPEKVAVSYPSLEKLRKTSCSKLAGCLGEPPAEIEAVRVEQDERAPESCNSNGERLAGVGPKTHSSPNGYGRRTACRDSAEGLDLPGSRSRVISVKGGSITAHQWTARDHLGVRDTWTPPPANASTYQCRSASGRENLRTAYVFSQPESASNIGTSTHSLAVLPCVTHQPADGPGSPLKRC